MTQDVESLTRRNRDILLFFFHTFQLIFFNAMQKSEIVCVISTLYEMWTIYISITTIKGKGKKKKKEEEKRGRDKKKREKCARPNIPITKIF